MKKLYFTLFAFAAVTSVSAQYRESHDLLDKLIWNEEMLHIMVDTRFDLLTTVNNGDMDAFSFNGQTMRLWFTGEIIPGIRYRVRHRLNKPQLPTERDNLAGATDHAWVAFDLGKHWTLTAGKQAIQLGTFEYDYSGADIYLGTMIYRDFDDYQIGVDAAWKFLGQTVHFQVVNSDSEQFAAASYKSKAMGGSVMWEGNLLGGALKTRWGYSAFQHTETKFYHWLTAGTQVNAGRFKTELDYYLGSRNMDYTSTVGLTTAETRYVQDQSAALNLEYNFGKWRPFIKGVWSERYDKAYGSAAYETWGVQAVAEYYPFNREEMKDLRFHLMYGYSQTDFRGQFAGRESTDTHTVLLGMRWLFKVK